MPRESLGFEKLEWVCSRCSARNPGPEKTCGSCGAPQPEDVQFVPAQKRQLIQDEREIEQIQKGADIHCPFCGTRNQADAKVCQQCGGDLKEGRRRASGRIVGAFTASDGTALSTCPACGAHNPATNLKCAQCGAPLGSPEEEAHDLSPEVRKASAEPSARRRLGIGLAVVGGIALICLFVFIFFGLKTETVRGIVRQVRWETYVVVEELQSVEHQGWFEELPAQATLQSCSLRLHHTQDEPDPNANKVCGTPYSVDTGSGYAEVVQDCYYEVFQDYCTYTQLEWVEGEVFRLHGEDFLPLWSNPNISENQRIGERGVEFQVVFETSDGDYIYTFEDEHLFQQFSIGSEWELKINAFGSVVSAEAVP